MLVFPLKLENECRTRQLEQSNLIPPSHDVAVINPREEGEVVSSCHIYHEGALSSVKVAESDFLK